MAALAATLPRVSKAENAVGRQDVPITPEGRVFYSLKNWRTGEIACHLLYKHLADAQATARYWSAAGWAAVPVVIKENYQ